MSKKNNLNLPEFGQEKINKIDKTISKLSASKTFKSDKKVTFYVRFSEEDYLWLKKFELFMINKTQNPQYSMSSAISDGAEVLQEKFQIKERPSGSVPARRGRRNDLNGEQRIQTSFYILESVKHFLWNFMYHKISDAGMVDYTQSDLISDLVKALKEKYKSEIDF